MTGGLCAAGSTLSSVQRGYASAAGSRAPEPDGGYWAGMSVCPWPRQSPSYLSGDLVLTATASVLSVTPRWTVGWHRIVQSSYLLTGADSEVFPQFAAVSPTFGRLSEGTDLLTTGQTAPDRFSCPSTVTDVTENACCSCSLQKPSTNVAEPLARRHKTC